MKDNLLSSSEKNKIIKRAKENFNLYQKGNNLKNSGSSGNEIYSGSKGLKDKYSNPIINKKVIPQSKKALIKQSKARMITKHNTSKNSYNSFILENLIYNKNCHLVSVFKEAMIMDYLEEFLKR